MFEKDSRNMCSPRQNCKIGLREENHQDTVFGDGSMSPVIISGLLCGGTNPLSVNFSSVK